MGSDGFLFFFSLAFNPSSFVSVFRCNCHASTPSPASSLCFIFSFCFSNFVFFLFFRTVIFSSGEYCILFFPWKILRFTPFVLRFGAAFFHLVFEAIFYSSFFFAFRPSFDEYKHSSLSFFPSFPPLPVACLFFPLRVLKLRFVGCFFFFFCGVLGFFSPPFYVGPDRFLQQFTVPSLFAKLLQNAALFPLLTPPPRPPPFGHDSVSFVFFHPPLRWSSRRIAEFLSPHLDSPRRRFLNTLFFMCPPSPRPFA